MSTDVPLPEPVAWRYVPSEVWGDAIVTQDAKTVALARDYGRDVEPLHTADQLRAYGDARAAALAGVLRLVVGDAEMFCRAAHHSKADRHEAFEPCPIHTRAVAALQERKYADQPISGEQP